MTTKYTLQDGLAFVVITGTKRFLTWRTSVAMIGYEDLDLETVRNVVNEEGMELARRSRIWKAHEHMLSLGFTADRDRRRNTPRFIYLLQSRRRSPWVYFQRLCLGFSGQ